MHCILVITKKIKVKKICFIANKIGDIKGIIPINILKKVQNRKFKTYNCIIRLEWNVQKFLMIF